ncbi:hypothetical protein PAMA_014552 [Pampus argenteus]
MDSFTLTPAVAAIQTTGTPSPPAVSTPPLQATPPYLPSVSPPPLQASTPPPPSVTLPPLQASTPPPAPSVTLPPLQASTPLEIGGKILTDTNVTNINSAALIGGLGVVLLVLILTIVVLLWCQCRHKGSYVTNETDEYDDEDDDDQSVGSDTALQSKAPLQVKEDE